MTFRKHVLRLTASCTVAALLIAALAEDLFAQDMSSPVTPKEHQRAPEQTI